jgi:hypothetical protein
MKISRRGTFSNRGYSHIKFDEKNTGYSWVAKEKHIEVTCSAIADFCTESQHDYIVNIPVNEIFEIVRVLGSKAVSDNPEYIGSEFRDVLVELMRIQHACIGKI